MKCPKCNTDLFFDDTYYEDQVDNNTKIIWEWFTFCPNCSSEYKVKEEYILTSQEIVEEIKEDE